MFEEEENSLFLVVINHEEQYSIWPKEREVPKGWEAEGKVGTRQKCLKHIEKVWTDMRPLSLRKSTEQAENHKNSD
jgi:MbtH protein|tara:strand:+ start:61 stop:288 length:228 start_codon:yes stop_codon:yes gene_type:complete